MITRRELIKGFGVGLAALAAPKIIFDLGANTYKNKLLVVNPAYEEAPYEEIMWTGEGYPITQEEINAGVIIPMNRRFYLDFNGDYQEIRQFIEI